MYDQDGDPGFSLDNALLEDAGIVDESIDPERWPKLEPEAIYPSIISNFVYLASEKSEADPAAILATFLSRLGVEIGPNPALWVGDGKHHCNLLVAIVGSTSNGRKGTSAKPVERLFRFTRQDYTLARTTPGPLSSGEGLIWAIRDPVKTWTIDNKTKAGQWVETDPGIDDKRLFVLSEELASAYQAMKREGSSLSPIIRSIFDSGDLDPLTKTSKCKATGAHIGIVGHITGYELAKLMEKNEIHNGLANRFMWFCSKRQNIIPIPEPMPLRELELLQSDLVDILLFAQSVRDMSFSDDAAALWAGIYPALSMPESGAIGTLLSRACVHCLRISMLFALVDKSDVIKPQHLSAALAVWRYAEQSVRYIFQSDQNPNFKKVIDALSAGPLTHTEIRKAVGKNIPKETLTNILKELTESGRIESKEIKGPGRSAWEYTLIR